MWPDVQCQLLSLSCAFLVFRPACYICNFLFLVSPFLGLVTGLRSAAQWSSRRRGDEIKPNRFGAGALCIGHTLFIYATGRTQDHQHFFALQYYTARFVLSV
jgi:hypothetical protein